jgi:hypothetical protein
VNVLAADAFAGVFNVEIGVTTAKDVFDSLCGK